MPVTESWEGFVERVLERLHRLHQSGQKADVLILMGRLDRTTGELLPPQLRVTEIG